MTDHELEAKINGLGSQYEKAAEMLVKSARQHKLTPNQFCAVVRRDGQRLEGLPGFVDAAAVRVEEIFELRVKLQIRLAKSLCRKGVSVAEIARRTDLKRSTVEEVVAVLKG